MAIEELLVRLKMEASQYKREARGAASSTNAIGDSAKTASTGVDRMKSGLRSLGPIASVAGLAATAAIGKFAADSIRDASNLQESINAINVVFGESADEINAIGETSAEAFGLSQRAFGEFSVRFSAFAKQIAERDGRRVVDVVEEMTGRVADFASVHNVSMERAAEVAQSTMAGETEVFRRFGGDVSAATVQAKLLEEGIIGVGEAATEQDKILGRYMLFMEQTADTAGDFKNTQDDLANAQRTFTAELEDARAEIGEALLPVMADLLSTGRDLIPVLIDIGKFIGVVATGAALVGAETALDRVRIAVGGTEDDLALLATAIGEVDQRFRNWNSPFTDERAEMAAEFKNLFDTMDLGASDIQRLIDNSDFLAETMGLSSDAVEILEELLRDELSVAAAETADKVHLLRGATKGAGDAASDAEGDVEGLTEAVDRQGGRWDDVITSIEEYETMLRRLADPVFKAIDDERALAEATQAYLDVIADPEATVGEQEQAMWDLLEAQLAVDESAAALPEDLDAVSTHLEILGRRAGITEEDLRRLREQILSFDGLEANSTVRVNVVGGERITGGNINTDISLRHSGGPGVAGERYLIRPDEEIFVPSGNGEFLLNDQVINALKGLSGGRSTTNNFNIPIQSSGDPNTDAQLVGAVHSVLRRMETL